MPYQMACVINTWIRLFLLIIINSVFCSTKGYSCTDTEIIALMDLKAGLTDPSGRLSSWVVGKDCCKWNGVICSNKTGHVVELKLQNSYPADPSDYEEDYSLGGEVSDSLLNLKELRYLDLSMNNFGGYPIPAFIGLLTSLQYFNLSGSSFGGIIPSSLGNLTNLVYLDLNNYFNETVENELTWLHNLSSLRHLNLGNVDLYKTADYWLDSINMLPSLSELHLSSCGLFNLPSSLPLVNFTSLSVLDLSSNGFNSSIPNWLFNLSSLVYLDISSNSLQGELSDEFERLTSLQYVDLSKNYNIGGKLSKAWGNLCNLKELVLSQNNISGTINEFIDELSTCSNISMETLDLGYNKLTGFLPESIGKLKSLSYLQLGENSLVGSIPDSIGDLKALTMLYIRWNQMNGEIPKSIGQLSELTALDISNNLWEGAVTEAHFSNLTRLKDLDITRKKTQNFTFFLNVSSSWIPPFKLLYFSTGSFKLGPNFPSWLRTQTELTALSISSAGITDTVPDWFCEMNLELSDLVIKHNQLSGRVPNLFKFVQNGYVDLSSNLFEGPFPLFSSNLTLLYLMNNYFSGPIPHDIGTKMPNLVNFDVSYNSLNGTIPLSIGEIPGLANIVLSNNNLTGDIPLIWNDKPNLYILDLSSNKLSGKIPASMGLLTSLMFLALSNNNLSGEIPSSLQNCTLIQSLDLGENNLSGPVPSWIGENMSSMLILRLRSNMFTGHIPPQLCHLTSLHILDLAENDLDGIIPSCMGNLTGMATDLTDVRYEGQLLVATKGREFLYNNTLYLVNSIDLSSNRLSGQMLRNLKSLTRLGTFNLSNNQFTGTIPNEIGNLQRMETLDLSRNQMSGSIPIAMASLNLLNHLNLSYNNFSGRIPTANQFLTFIDPSIYRNNTELCGAPLTVKCPGDDDSPHVNSENGDNDNDDDDDFDMFWFYVSIGPGFAIGFWGFWGTLIVKRTWRAAYFEFFDRVSDKLIVVSKICIRRLKTGK